MTILKSTYQIVNDPWGQVEDRVVQTKTPRWNKNVPITFKDVVIWEQIYHQPGNVGVYVAHSPREEFYLVVYDLFSKEKAGIKTFYGENAVKDVVNLIGKLGISLEETWIQN